MRSIAVLLTDALTDRAGSCLEKKQQEKWIFENALKMKRSRNDAPFLERFFDFSALVNRGLPDKDCAFFTKKRELKGREKDKKIVKFIKDI